MKDKFLPMNEKKDLLCKSSPAVIIIGFSIFISVGNSASAIDIIIDCETYSPSDIQRIITLTGSVTSENVFPLNPPIEELNVKSSKIYEELYLIFFPTHFTGI